MRELEERFDAMAQSAIELHNYTGSLFDVAFEITTADTFIAGVASKIIDGNRMIKKDESIVQRPLLLEWRWWQCEDGSVFDLSESPEMTSTKINSEKQQRLRWPSYSIQIVVFEVLGPFACQLECDALVSQLVHPNTGRDRCGALK